jgi:hypothetical protein
MNTAGGCPSLKQVALVGKGEPIVATGRLIAALLKADQESRQVSLHSSRRTKLRGPALAALSRLFAESTR